MMRRTLLAWMLGGSLMVTGGCSGSGGGDGAMPAAPQAPASNQVPRISGSPATSIVQNMNYAFRPSASDPDGDPLAFRIAHKPGWAAFDRRTGRLSGTPRAGNVGAYSNIRISVSDGRSTAWLPAFTISVTQSGSGSVTLSWLPPTENDNGTVLRDLAGYRIYAGRRADALNQVIALNNPGLTRYVVEDLPPARWYFAMTSVNFRGRESRRSATVSKAVG